MKYPRWSRECAAAIKAVAPRNRVGRQLRRCNCYTGQRLLEVLAVPLPPARTGDEAHAADLSSALAAGAGGNLAGSPASRGDPVGRLPVHQYGPRWVATAALRLLQRLDGCRRASSAPLAIASDCAGPRPSRSQRPLRWRSTSHARPMSPSSTSSSGRSAEAQAGCLTAARQPARDAVSANSSAKRGQSSRGQVVAHALDERRPAPGMARAVSRPPLGRTSGVGGCRG